MAHSSSPPGCPSWHQEADLHIADADADTDTATDLVLDIDDFESLCDDLFNSASLGDPQVKPFQTWAGEVQDESAAVDDRLADGSPVAKKWSRRSRRNRMAMPKTGGMF